MLTSARTEKGVQGSCIMAVLFVQLTKAPSEGAGERWSLALALFIKHPKKAKEKEAYLSLHKYVT